MDFLYGKQGWTLAPVRPPAAGNFGVGRVDSQKYPSRWRVTFLTTWSVDSIVEWVAVSSKLKMKNKTPHTHPYTHEEKTHRNQT